MTTTHLIIGPTGSRRWRAVLLLLAAAAITVGSGGVLTAVGPAFAGATGGSAPPGAANRGMPGRPATESSESSVIRPVTIRPVTRYPAGSTPYLADRTPRGVMTPGDIATVFAVSAIAACALAVGARYALAAVCGTVSISHVPDETNGGE